MGLFGRRKEQDGSECARCKGKFPETTYVQKHGHLCTECFGALILEMSQEKDDSASDGETIAAEREQLEISTSCLEEVVEEDRKEDESIQVSREVEERAPTIFEKDREESEPTAEEENNCSLLMTKDVVWVKGSDEAKKARQVMIKNGFSQLPVFGDKIHPSQLLGLLTDKNICNHRHDLMGLKVEMIMDAPPPTVSPTIGIRAIEELLNHGAGCVIVRDRNSVLGIITRENLM